jgi:antitoxin HigA-1
MRMFNPPYPGLILREDVLPSFALSIADAAAQLGISRTTLSRVLNGRTPISPTMALRIEAWLGDDRGGGAENWLAMQAAYDLWHARKTMSKIKRAKLLPSA